MGLLRARRPRLRGHRAPRLRRGCDRARASRSMICSAAQLPAAASCSAPCRSPPRSRSRRRSRFSRRGTADHGALVGLLIANGLDDSSSGHYWIVFGVARLLAVVINLVVNRLRDVLYCARGAEPLRLSYWKEATTNCSCDGAAPAADGLFA